MDKSILVGENHLLLFVAGLPSKASPVDVYKHFSEFGSFRLLRLRNEKKGCRIVQANPQNNIRRGFCVIEAADQDSYHSVLSRQDMQFQNRKLYISRFKEDRSQYMTDTTIYQRQVIISGFPPNSSQFLIYRSIEQMIGKVKRLYLVLDSLSAIYPGKQFREQDDNYLVEFYAQASAEKALNLRKVAFGWSFWPFVIYPFKQDPRSVKCKQIFITQQQSPWMLLHKPVQKAAFKGWLPCNISSKKVTSTASPGQEQRGFNFFHFEKPTCRNYYDHKKSAQDLLPADNERQPSFESLRFNIVLQRK